MKKNMNGFRGFFIGFAILVISFFVSLFFVGCAKDPVLEGSPAIVEIKINDTAKTVDGFSEVKVTVYTQNTFGVTYSGLYGGCIHIVGDSAQFSVEIENGVRTPVVITAIDKWPDPTKWDQDTMWILIPASITTPPDDTIPVDTIPVDTTINNTDNYDAFCKKWFCLSIRYISASGEVDNSILMVVDTVIFNKDQTYNAHYKSGYYGGLWSVVDSSWTKVFWGGLESNLRYNDNGNMILTTENNGPGTGVFETVWAF